MYGQARCIVTKTGSIPFLFALTLLACLLWFLPARMAMAAGNSSKPVEAHLKIPRIGVDAVIKDMGLTPEGAMAVPGNRIDVGWYSSGTRPGETGSAVIGGHNRWDKKVAAFNRLDRLKKGDVLSVVDAQGVSTFFAVREKITFNATDTDSGIFSSEDGIHLNLVTCNGIWNPVTKNYPSRLVVFTDAIRIAANKPNQ